MPSCLQSSRRWVFYSTLRIGGHCERGTQGHRFLYAKISNCIVSYFICSSGGYPGSAGMVVRSLFEAHVHLGIILEKDTLERSKLFEDSLTSKVSYTFSMQRLLRKLRGRHQKYLLASVRGNYHPDKTNYSWVGKIVQSKQKGKAESEPPFFSRNCVSMLASSVLREIYGRFSAAIHTVPS